MAIPNISHILVKYNTILSHFTCIFTFNSHNNTVTYYCYFHEAKRGWVFSNSAESQTRPLGLTSETSFLTLAHNLCSNDLWMCLSPLLNSESLKDKDRALLILCVKHRAECKNHNRCLIKV